MLFLPRKRRPKVRVSLGITRLDSHGLAEHVDCVVESARLLKRVAEFGLRVCIIGLEPDRLAKRCDGLVVLSLSRQRRAEIAMSFGIAGLEADRFPVRNDRFIALPRLLECVSQAKLLFRGIGLSRIASASSRLDSSIFPSWSRQSPASCGQRCSAVDRQRRFIRAGGRGRIRGVVPSSCKSPHVMQTQKSRGKRREATSKTAAPAGRSLASFSIRHKSIKLLAGCCSSAFASAAHALSTGSAPAALVLLIAHCPAPSVRDRQRGPRRPAGAGRDVQDLVANARPHVDHGGDLRRLRVARQAPAVLASTTSRSSP